MARKITKAFLLAAGLGTRLRPLTDSLPKCLVPIGNQPLLNIWINICDELGIEEVLINTHHLPEKVREWAGLLKARVKIRLVHEEVLLGSTGTVGSNRDFVSGEDEFFIFYADNLIRGSFDDFRTFHGRHDGILTVGLFRAPEPKRCGIVTMDDSGRITNFEEKPSQPKSNLANAGIYLARREILDYLPYQGFADFGHDIIPKLVTNIWGYCLDAYLRDVGTPQSYQEAQREWMSLNSPIQSTRNRFETKKDTAGNAR